MVERRGHTVTSGSAGFPASPLPSWVHLGHGAQVDAGALLGYQPARKIPNLELHIGPDARIRSGTVVYGGSRIGAKLETGHNVVLREECSIDDGFHVWNGSVVDYGCTIGRGVKVHANCYIAQGSVLEAECFLAPGVVLANDLYPGMARSKEVMRGPRIGKGAQVGCNATVNPFVRVGAGALVGAGAVVTKDVPGGMVAAGNPARAVKKVSELRDSEPERRAREGR